MGEADMSAAYALKAARAAGVELGLDGTDLLVKAASEPPAEVLDALTRHKAEIVPLLRPARDGWCATDWQAFFEERAAIAEFDGGLSRYNAQIQAFGCCVVEWLNHNLGRSAYGRCVECGKPEYSYDPLLPFGTESIGHAWLHSGCWPTWQSSRKAEAIKALARLGIDQPGKSR
jgi:hypothetical protein